MHAAVRAFPLALVFAVSFARSAEEALPSIFAPKQRPAPAILSRARIEAPSVSERVRVGLNAASYRALATAEPFDAPTAPTGRATVIMDTFVVRAAPLVVKERAIPDPPLLDFLKTGRFYHTETMEVALKLKILQQPGLGWGREFTRGEIQFSFRW